MEENNVNINLQKTNCSTSKKIIAIKPIIKKFEPNPETLKNLKAVFSSQKIQDQLKSAVDKLEADDALPSPNNVSIINCGKSKSKNFLQLDSVKETLRCSILHKNNKNQEKYTDKNLNNNSSFLKNKSISPPNSNIIPVCDNSLQYEQNPKLISSIHRTQENLISNNQNRTNPQSCIILNPKQHAASVSTKQQIVTTKKNISKFDANRINQSPIKANILNKKFSETNDLKISNTKHDNFTFTQGKKNNEYTISKAENFKELNTKVYRELSESGTESESETEILRLNKMQKLTDHKTGLISLNTSPKKNENHSYLNNSSPKSIPSFEKLSTYLYDKRQGEDIHPKSPIISQSNKQSDKNGKSSHDRARVKNTNSHVSPIVKLKQKPMKNKNFNNIEENNAVKIEVHTQGECINYKVNLPTIPCLKTEPYLVPEMKIKKASINIEGKQTDNYKADILEKRVTNEEKTALAQSIIRNSIEKHTIFKSPENPPKNKVDDINFHDVFLMSEIEEYNNQNNVFNNKNEGNNIQLSDSEFDMNDSLIGSPVNNEFSEKNYEYSPRLIQDLDSNKIFKQKPLSYSPKLPQNFEMNTIIKHKPIQYFEEISDGTTKPSPIKSFKTEISATNQVETDAVDFLCSLDNTLVGNEEDDVSDTSSSIDETDILRPEDFINNISNPLYSDDLKRNNDIFTTLDNHSNIYDNITKKGMKKEIIDTKLSEKKELPVVIENKILSDSEKISLDLCLSSLLDTENCNENLNLNLSCIKKEKQVPKPIATREIQENTTSFLDNSNLPIIYQELSTKQYNYDQTDSKELQIKANNIEEINSLPIIETPNPKNGSQLLTVEATNSKNDDLHKTSCNSNEAYSKEDSFAMEVDSVEINENENLDTNIIQKINKKLTHQQNIKPKAVPISSRRPGLKGSKINLVQRRKGNKIGNKNDTISNKPDSEENPSISPHIPNNKTEDIIEAKDEDKSILSTKINNENCIFLQNNENIKSVDEKILNENQNDKKKKGEEEYLNKNNTETYMDDNTIKTKEISKDNYFNTHELDPNYNEINFDLQRSPDSRSNEDFNAFESDNSYGSDLSIKFDFKGFDLSNIKSEQNSILNSINASKLIQLEIENAIKEQLVKTVNLETISTPQASGSNSVLDENQKPINNHISDQTIEQNIPNNIIKIEKNSELILKKRTSQDFTILNRSEHNNTDSIVANELPNNSQEKICLNRKRKISTLSQNSLIKNCKVLNTDSDSYGEEDSVPLKKRHIRNVYSNSSRSELENNRKESKIVILEKRAYFSTRKDSETSTTSDHNQSNLTAEEIFDINETLNKDSMNEIIENCKNKSDTNLKNLLSKDDSIRKSTETLIETNSRSEIVTNDKQTLDPKPVEKLKIEKKAVLEDEEKINELDNSFLKNEKKISEISTPKLKQNKKKSIRKIEKAKKSNPKESQKIASLDESINSNNLSKSLKENLKTDNIRQHFATKNSLEQKSNPELKDSPIEKQDGKVKQSTLDSFLINSPVQLTPPLNSKIDITSDEPNIQKKKRGRPSKNLSNKPPTPTKSVSTKPTKLFKDAFEKFCNDLLPNAKQGRKLNTNNSWSNRKLHPNLLLTNNRCDIDNLSPIKNIQTPSENEIVCGLCKEMIAKEVPEWKSHLFTHYGVGWIEGKQAIDITHYNSVLNSIINYMKVTNCKVLICRMCQTEYKSGLGILSHILGCGLSEDEKKNATHVPCEHCHTNIHYLLFSGHAKVCPALNINSEKETDTAKCNENLETNEILSNTGRLKRKSTVHAESKFKEMQEDFENVDFSKYIKTLNTLRNSMYKSWQKKMNNGEKIECCGDKCKEIFNDFQKLKDHTNNCTKVLRTIFSCLLCKFKNSNVDVVKNHVNQKHANILNNSILDESGSEVEFSNKDLSESSEECSSGVDENENSDRGETKYDSGSEASPKTKKRKKNTNLTTPKPSNPFNCAHKSKDLIPIARKSFNEVSELANNSTKYFYEKHFSSEPLFNSCLPKFSVNSSIKKSEFEFLENISMKFNFTKVGINPYFGSSTLSDFSKLEALKTFDDQGQLVLFIGTPIITLEWIPLPSSVSCKIQYLAVSCKSNYNKYTRVLNPKSHKTLILIYKLETSEENFNLNSDMNFDSISCKLEYGIFCEKGPVHDMKFLPSGGYDCDMNRLGLLAVCSIDKDVNIYSLPIRITEESHKISDIGFNLIELKPVMILTLKDGFNGSKEILTKKDHYFVQCNKIIWSKAKGHNILATGYVNGCVALWNIKIDCNLNCLNNYNNDGALHFTPISYFKISDKFITGLDFHYDHKEPRWLVAASQNRITQIFDIEDPINPIIIREDNSKSILSSAKWPIIWENIVTGYGSDVCLAGPLTVSPMELIFLRRRCAQTAGGVTCIDFNPLNNACIYGNENGDFSIELRTEYNLDCTSKRYADTKIFTYTDLIKLDGSKHQTIERLKVKNDCNKTKGKSKEAVLQIDSKLNEDVEPLQFFEKDYRNKYGLVFGPLTFSTKEKGMNNEKRCAPFNLNSYVRINCVACNGNINGENFYTFGCENGFIRILYKHLPNT